MNSIAKFLSQYAAVILAAGSSSARCEKTVYRMAKKFGVEVGITILPRSVMVSVKEIGSDNTFTVNQRIPEIGLNFNFISNLSRLSWEVRDTDITLAQAEEKFNKILEEKRLNTTLVTILTGFANASFCRLFGGDWMAMLLVFIATVNGFWLKNALHKTWHWDMRMAILIAACSSSIIASCGFLLNITQTPDIALGTSVLHLIPGIPYINSVSDLIHGHLLCSVSRFINASIITICLGIGLSLGILIMNIHYF